MLEQLLLAQHGSGQEDVLSRHLLPSQTTLPPEPHIPGLLFKGMGVSSFATALTKITTGNTTIHSTAM